MHNYRLSISCGLQFGSADEALRYIGEKMVKDGICRDSYPAALLAREVAFPTGIALDGHAVAIPHCEATHAIEPAVCLIRPASPVKFQQADDDGMIDAELIIALVVTHPEQQLDLLRSLFGQLQQPEFIESLLSAPEEEIADVFNSRLFAPAA
ncbi:PTS galactitol transporter subunit IIA [Erwinia mallotivora]|uniref:PTS system galactitol-specific transporter subunit IIA n=1 Tax=Erwinia mallotivora TaxID=69222 RepID=A0A014Q0S0_9GAMM|nr:PTS galactitol transporter subunit IIA [Erwinia mallotivora]EXU76737.1 PTS system galactitol-specific transporter subunit IIA [Erwinia mallotivora]